MRIGRDVTGIIWGIAAASMLGCGGGGGGPVPIDQLGTQYASVFCHKAFTCCDAAELAGGPAATDEATCRSVVASLISLAHDNASIAAGRAVYHGDSARRCLDLIAALPCAQWGAGRATPAVSPTMGELARFPDCQRIFEGLVAPNGTCVRNAECADGFCDTSAGVCAAPPKLGEYCRLGVCAAGLTCLDSSTTGTPDVCGAPLGDGSTCNFDSECASAFCNLDNSNGAQTCGPATFCNGV